nr:subtilase family serine protease [uncultured bacterium]
MNDGCSTPFTNDVSGKVVIVRRGTCGFAVKAKNAQLMGAKAIIIANNAAGTGPMGMGGTDSSVTIPAISVGTDNGTALIAAGSFTSAGFTPHPTRIAGLASDGHLRLYAPTAVAVGSTASHWDVVAEPSLLMEPFNTVLLEASHNVDLTVSLFEDIGWKTEISLAGCGAGSGTRGASVTGEIYAAPIFICADNAATKGDFQSCTVQHLSNLRNAGIISGVTKGTLGVCAANGK